MHTFAILVMFGIMTGCAATTGGGATTCPDGDVVDPASGACVQCVPGVAGQCGDGAYCSDEGTCVNGCQIDADCGAAGDCCGGECVDLTSDANHCGACGNSCGSGEGCCDSSCIMTNTLEDCGACGNTCTDGEFCDGTQCNAAVYPNFCANKKVIVIHDGIAADNASADVMASTITANCPADVMVTTSNQTDATLVNQETGQPLAGSGVTYVLGGGPYPNMPLRWLEREQKITKVYFDAPDGINYYWKLRETNAAVSTMPATQCSTRRDRFIVELVTDPGSGTLSLIGYGACSGGRGTRAAAYYYANVMLPDRMNYPDSWYVYSWYDENNNQTPDSGDTFTRIASGM